jgi:IS5 family transposase
MRPNKSQIEERQGELFRTELSRIIDPGHELVRLTAAVDWEGLEEAFGQYFCAGNGRPAVATRLMVTLHWLKYEHDLSDEEVVRMWRENPYWQWLGGMKWFEHAEPINPTTMTKWRNRVGEAGAETLLAETLKAGLKVKAIKPSQLKRVNVDTTVQEKHVRHPTDARLYDRARERLVKEAAKRGVKPRQTYARLAKRSLLMQSRYAHTRKPKMAMGERRKLRTWLGRVLREIERKVPRPWSKLADLLHTARRIHTQGKGGKGRIYSVHEPHVECIAKGKAYKKWEFGCKTSLVVTSRGGWILGAKTFHGNPYDAHTLPAAIEPTIGHLKEHRRLDRNRLHGIEGDLVNPLYSACGMNIGKILKHLRTLCALMLRWLRILLCPPQPLRPSLLPT